MKNLIIYLLLEANIGNIKVSKLPIWRHSDWSAMSHMAKYANKNMNIVKIIIKIILLRLKILAIRSVIVLIPNGLLFDLSQTHNP